MKRFFLQAFFTRYGPALILVGIVITAAYFRFINLSGYIWSMAGYDESRDMLIAKHIVNYGEYVLRGPLAAGGLNVLKNSPFYYYFVAMLWFIGRSPHGVMCIWSFLTVCMVILAYRIGCNIWDRWAGLCIAALVAVHPELVVMSKQIGQPNVLLLWFLFFIWILTRKKQMSVFDLSINILLLFLSLHIHYGSLIIIPVCYAWIMRVWWRSKKITRNLTTIIIPFVISEYAVLLWVLLTYWSAPFDQVYFLKLNVIGAHSPFISSLLEVSRELLQLVWSKLDLRYAAVFTISTPVIILFWSKRKRILLQLQEDVFWLFASVIIPVFLYSIYTGHITPTYLLSLIPISLILIGITIRIIISMRPIIGVAILSALVYFFMNQSHPLYKVPFLESIYRKNLLVANAIYLDYVNINDGISSVLNGTNRDIEIPSIIIATLDVSGYLVYDGWGTGSTWFWLEDLFHQRLISLTDYGNNFVPNVTSPKYFYVICDHRDVGFNYADVCLKRFTLARSYVSKTYESIFQSNTYTVWRFGIINSPQGQFYNIAYNELLDLKE